MSGIGKFKLSDALGNAEGGPAKSSRTSSLKAKGQTKATAAEQAREALEAAEAKNAEASFRGHMVEIGRGNQQAGRQQGGGRRGK
ncbi:hypothetical protein [Paludisphaera mucosa]|uniref:Uncharacterized protein n=1 Tax=Paludisphaera mucosa TaxID=3030827 RepID=A0ABT6FD82_9BACT|nr:hypothetical protein [Paludisphaera mucosa]MDG3005529.1 hypothetical protein [Paludisphaera mucosa]